MADVYTSR